MDIIEQGDRQKARKKIVSIKSEARVLYNVAEVRTELNELAAKEPERLAAMIKKWTQMSRDVLHAPERTYAPTGKAQPVHSNREWTKFEKEAPTDKSKKRTRAGANHSIRARKNTKLNITDGTLHLVFSGDDPGIAMDLRNKAIAAGPYHLAFELKGGSEGGGELFFTTDPKTILTKGNRIPFEVAADGDWQKIDIQLKTGKAIQQLRLDVSEGSGEASIRQFRLTDDSGKVLLKWPNR